MTLARTVLQHRLTRNVAALMLLQVFTYLTPLVVLSYLTRVLGVSTYGVVAFAVSITQAAAVLIDLGFTLSATQKISVWRNNRHYVNHLLGAVFVAKAIAFVPVLCALCAYALNTETYKDHATLIILSALPLLGHCFQATWFFLGVEKMRNVTIFMVATKLAYVLLIILLVSNERDCDWVPVADAIAQAAGAAISLYLIYCSGYRVAIPRRRDIAYALGMTREFFASRLSVMAYANCGVLVLGFFVAPATVAIYALAERLYMGMQQIFVPLVQALYPYSAKERNVPLLGKVAAVTAGIALIGALIGHLMAPHLVPALFGPGFDEVVSVLNVFFIALVVHVLTVIAGYPLAAALDQLQVANRSVLCGSVVYVGGALALLFSGVATPRLFAWLMVVSELSVLLYRAARLCPEAWRMSQLTRQVESES